MATRTNTHSKMRIVHRYLGFFLAGIMAVYAFSGVIMIFRDTDFLKRDKIITQQLSPALSADQVGKALRLRDLAVTSQNTDSMVFKQGSYNKVTGLARYKQTVLPTFVEKLTKLHKANSNSPLFWLNVFFGVSLLFFVISSFWMFLPGTSIFKKGIYFTLAGLILTIILLWL